MAGSLRRWPASARRGPAARAHPAPAAGHRVRRTATVSLPCRRPSSTVTRVSSRSDSEASSRASAGACGARPARGRGSRGALVGGDQLLGGPHRQALGNDPGGEPLLLLRIGQPEQRPGMSGADHPGGDPTLHGRWQAEQPDRVADLRARAADPVGELVMGGAELLQQLLVGGRLFQRVQRLAVQVLQQGIAQQRVVGGVANDRRDGRRGRPPGRPASRRSPITSW